MYHTVTCLVKIHTSVTEHSTSNTVSAQIFLKVWNLNICIYIYIYIYSNIHDNIFAHIWTHILHTCSHICDIMLRIY